MRNLSLSRNGKTHFGTKKYSTQYSSIPVAMATSYSVL